MSPVLFCFVLNLGLCFHAFPIIINALIVYFTEKLISWEFTDELLLLLLGAVIMSVMYKLQGCLEKVTSDKLPDSPSKFPCFQL